MIQFNIVRDGKMEISFTGCIEMQHFTPECIQSRKRKKQQIRKKSGFLKLFKKSSGCSSFCLAPSADGRRN